MTTRALTKLLFVQHIGWLDADEQSGPLVPAEISVDTQNTGEGGRTRTQPDWHIETLYNYTKQTEELRGGGIGGWFYRCAALRLAHLSWLWQGADGEGKSGREDDRDKHCVGEDGVVER